jgi:glycosyltransferase involved in cell wall biosynthesis
VRPAPILILGDAPERVGGLSRITKDIAGQLSRSPRFRVATLGREASSSRRLPFQQYAIHQRVGVPNSEWGLADLRRVWEDWAGKERGVVMTIYDPTRTLWLSRPEFSGDPELAQWLQLDHFDLWGYVTLDATGPQDKLSQIATESLMGYRRLLAYTKWSEGVIGRSLGQQESTRRHLDWLPHGLDLLKWPLRDKREARERLYPFLHEGEQLIGAIGTNQPRKDWGLVAMTCQQLVARNPRSKFWWHTDLMERHWSINALLADFGLSRSTTVTTSGTNLSQDEMSWWLNSCDLTLHPGLGEGFGYPIFESLASGTPVVHGDYGGGADVLRQCLGGKYLISPEAHRLDGPYNQLRPVYDPRCWAAMSESILGGEPVDRDSLRASVAHLGWEALWSMWERWFLEGIGA